MASPFKVIIVGGGPVGLTAARALQLADIDFILLERRDTITPDKGGAMVVSPSSLRVLAQMGLLDAVQKVGAELDRKRTFLQDGTVIKKRSHFSIYTANHGITATSIQRGDLVRILYGCLPETSQANVLTGKKVTDVESNDQGVKVTCLDGSSYEGSMVIGADGTYSIIRQLMRKQVLEADPKADWDPEMPYLSAYQCLWCRMPIPTGIGDVYDTQHSDCSVMYFADKKNGTMFLYEKLAEPTKERARYTDEDAQAFVERMGHFPVTETLTVKDMFAMRSAFGMVNLEEGLVENWSSGRIVLAGDSCHKFTPNAGLGYQTSIQDIVALSNRLRKLLTDEPSGLPTTETLQATFKAYQEERSKDILEDHTFSAKVIRMQTWATTLYYFLARYFLPTWLSDYLAFNVRAARLNSEGLVLNYVHVEEPFSGRVPWKHKISPLVSKD